MTKALSRKSRGNDQEMRESARSEARRSGKSLGDWLDDAIRDFDREEEEVEREDDDRLDAVARRLARPAGGRENPRREEEDYRQPRRWRDDADDMRAAARRERDDRFDDEDEDLERAPRSRRDAEKRDVEARAEPARQRREPEPGRRRWRDEARVDPKAIVADAAAIVERRVAESERHTARAFENLADLIKRGQRRGEGDAVKRAVAAFAQRAEQSERHTARALDNLAGLLEDGQRRRETAEEGLAFLAERLGRIESRLAEQPAASGAVKPIRTALARLESRLDRLSTSERGPDFEQALSSLDRRLSEIASRLDGDARAPKAAPVVPAPSVDLAGPSPAALEQGLRRAEPLTRRPLVDAIAEITQRQRALDDTPAPVSPALAVPAPDLWEGQPPAQRFAALHASLDTLTQQLDTVRQDAGERADQQMVVMRQIEGLRREVEDMSRAIGDLAPRASVAAIETALRDLAHRVDMQRHRGVSDDLLAPAERIAGELRAVIRDLDPSPIVRNLHADVQTIGRRLDAMQQPSAADAAAIRQLSAQTREIREQLSALASRPLPIEKIETRLFDLTQRVDALAHAGVGAAKAAAALDMGELARSIRTIVAAETNAGIDTFNRRLEQVATKLDEAVLSAGAKRFDELGERIDELGRTLSRRIEDSAVAQKPVDTASLEQLIASLALKIDSALDDRPHNPGFEEIGRKIERLETRLSDPTPGVEEIGRKIERLENRINDPIAADSIARIEAMLQRPVADRQFAELAQRIDFVRETLAQRLDQGAAAAPASDVRFIEEIVRGLDQKVEAALAAPSKAPDLGAIQNQLEALFYKVDRLEDASANSRLGAMLAEPQHHPQLEDIATRLERMQAALSQRADEGYRVEARQNDLAALVEQLAARMNQALDPRADSEALRALEAQIGALSQRLDRNDQNGAALAGVESRIAALVSQMEETKAATTLAAEEAVRRATQDILRQANPVPGALREALERELIDIRNIQDESGQRTHETLLAVHETLERVVDRLAVFEDELTEIRSAAVAAPAVSAVEPALARRIDDAPQALRAPEPAVEPRRAPPVAADGDDDLVDFLVPPGGPRPQRREPGFAPAAEAPRNDAVQTDFIAAARRAAQQAAMDAEAAEKAQQARRNAPRSDAAGARKPAASLASTLEDRKRPLLLGLAGVVLLAGAFGMTRMALQGRGAEHQDHQVTEAAPADTDAAPAATADAPEAAPKEAAPAPAAPARAAAPAATPAAPAPAPVAATPAQPTPPVSSAPAEPVRIVRPPSLAPEAPRTAPGMMSPGGVGASPPRMIAPRTDNAPVDTMPVGSIGGLNPLSAPDAIGVIKSLAQQGDSAAQYELAVRFADGRGVARDAKTAAQWFEKAAAQGLAPAQYRLGSFYEKGVGVERDYSRAKKYYQSAADAGNARAMHNLAVLLAEGGDGGKPDYAAASEWFRKAAEYGVRDSQYNLAILYARGLGVTQSMTQSYLWFAAAADQGDADAAKKRDEVAARLDTKDLSTAKSLAAGFKPREPRREANDVLPPKGGWENLKDPAMNAGKPSAGSGAKAMQKAKLSAI
ncbi:peptidoglycan-binding protein [Methylocystis parvus]|uniref:peptidoglycan-binding protein n=1 Tax=Methylocystis parvus TaxID=134 RepID=UPI003C73F357